MKQFATILLAGLFALIATLAVAQSDPHHPSAEDSNANAVTEDAAPETAEPELQKATPDVACPNAASMMMDMMAMMGSGDDAMPTMQMMQETQVEMMRTISMMQEQMALMQQRLETLVQSAEKSP